MKLVLKFALSGLLIAASHWLLADTSELEEEYKEMFRLRRSNPSRTIQLADSFLEVGSRMYDTLKIGKAHYYKGYARHRLGQNQEAIAHFDTCIRIARQYQNNWYEYESTYSQSIVYFYLGDMDRSMRGFSRALEIALKDDPSDGVFRAYNGMSYVYRELGQLDSCIIIQSNIIKEAKRTGNKKMLWSTSYAMGVTYHDLGQYEKSFETGLVALSVAGDIRDKYAPAKTCIQMGIGYLATEDYEKANEYFRRAHEDLKNSNEYYVRMDLHGNWSELFEKQENLKLAKYHAAQCINFLEKTKYSNFSAIMFNRLGQIYLKEGKIDSALTLTIKCKDLLKENDSKINWIHYGLLASSAYQAAGMTDKSIEAGLAAIHEADDSVLPEFKKVIHKTLSEEFARKGAYKQALIHSNRSLELEAENSDLEATREVSRMEAKYKYEKEKELLKQQQEQRELELQQEILNERWLGIGGVAFLMLVLIAGYYSYKTKVKANRKLRAKNQIIEVQNQKIALSAENEKILLTEQIKSRDRELAGYAMQFNERNDTLRKLEDKIDLLVSQSSDHNTELKDIKKMIKSNLKQQEEVWDNFISKFEDIYPNFFERLKIDFEDLSLNQLKISAYLKVGMDNREIANVTHIEINSVKKNISRIKKKMNLGPNDSIRDFLISYN